MQVTTTIGSVADVARRLPGCWPSLVPSHPGPSVCADAACGTADIPFGVGWPYWKSGQPVHAVCPDPATKPTVLIALNEQVADSWREDYPGVEVKVVPELPRSS